MCGNNHAKRCVGPFSCFRSAMKSGRCFKEISGHASRRTCRRFSTFLFFQRRSNIFSCPEKMTRSFSQSSRTLRVLGTRGRKFERPRLPYCPGTLEIHQSQNQTDASRKDFPMPRSSRPASMVVNSSANPPLLNVGIS